MTDWDALPALLTVAEAAGLLRVNPHTVYELVRTHSIPHTHLGRAIRIPRDALRQHIDAPHPITDPDFAEPQPRLARPRTQPTGSAGRITAAGHHGRR